MFEKNTSKLLKLCLCGIAGFSILMSHQALAYRTSMQKNIRPRTVVNNANKEEQQVLKELKEQASYKGVEHENVVESPVCETTVEVPNHTQIFLDDKPLLSKDGKNILLFDGWKLSTTGGLSYKNPKDQRYWFEFNGIMRLDQTFFSGSYRDKGGEFQNTDRFRVNDFPNSGFVRLIETYFESGLGENWLSMIGVTFTGLRTNFADSYIGYTGFAENHELNIGRFSGNWFGLESSTGGSWMAFMERSLQANAFYPGDGVGVLTDMWWTMGAITLVATQPDHGTHIHVLPGNIPEGKRYKSDRWRFIGRGTFSPVHKLGDVWHFGASYAYRQNDSTLSGRQVLDFGLATGPGLRGRNVRQIVRTPFLRAHYAHQFNLEAAKQWGPFMLEAEYTQMYVHRVAYTERTVVNNTPRINHFPLSPVRFHGWNVQARYMLTGECHVYDVRDGSFGKVDISSPYGAYEIVARYDYTTLNDKDVRGGSQHNTSVGFNWFINPQVRFTADYIRANIRPANDRLPRYLDIFGLRLQVRFK